KPLRMPGETSGNYKPHDHGLQPENLHQHHHSNSGRESLHKNVAQCNYEGWLSGLE
ncbi:hypothetical protein L9F63_013438, partial [Diploptera punctata]